MANAHDVFTVVIDGERNLRGFDLRNAPLAKLDLRGADLSGARLNGADLRNADLRGVLLMNTDMRTADLRGADLRGAEVESVRVGGVLYGFEPMTFWPEGYSRGLNRNSRIVEDGLRVPRAISMTAFGFKSDVFDPDVILTSHARAARLNSQVESLDCGHEGIGLNPAGRSSV